MTPENFCYWMAGWFELNETIDHRDGATPETLKMIKDHLDLVFKKVTPAAKNKPTVGEAYAELNRINKERKEKGEDTLYC